jgi:hypothetical protein
MTRRRILTALLLAATLVASRGAAETLEPLELDWQQVFRLHWEISERYRKPRLTGKIENISFWGTSQIQLLVERLDAGGRPVTQEIVWLGFKLNPSDSGWFDVAVPDRTAASRIRVYAFNRKFGTSGS